MGYTHVTVMTVFSVNNRTGAVHRPERMNYYLTKGTDINPIGMEYGD